MKRSLIGLLLIVHGLAHAGAGVWAAGVGPLWIVTPLWGIAMLGYMGAGFGVLRVRGLATWWREVLAAATAASYLLIVLFAPSALYGGIAIGAVLFVAAIRYGGTDPVATSAPPPLRAGVVRALALVWLAYATAVVAFRPMYLHWGTTPVERAMSLPGDQRVLNPTYRVDHAITIRAPANAVWPWLAQLGQDRGGFYSYAWLERMVGDHITNADRIHPEWQRRAVGDLVRATQPDYLGGRLGDLGWRVAELDSGRAIVLENWGAFVVHPVDGRTTRLIVRTRGAGTPSLRATVLGPLSVFVMEPAHFIMQRGMLRGIRDRAERVAATLATEE
jgi:hypothetical protein